MLFYNGFNLLVDILLVTVTYIIANSIGYRQGEEDNAPPF